MENAKEDTHANNAAKAENRKEETEMPIVDMRKKVMRKSYKQQEALQKKILARMKEMGMKPFCSTGFADNSSIAFKPAGVAAQPRPNIFAIIFVVILASAG